MTITQPTQASYSLTATKEGMASAERGDLKPAEQVFSEMQAKYGLHG